MNSRGNCPRGSVIIPVYNGATVIERCLNALSVQSLPPGDYEILVVDDGSTDETPQVVTQWGATHPALCVQFVQQANAGPAAARNRGAEAARAPLLLFTDADCAPAPDWIATLLAAFDEMPGELPLVGAKGTYLSQQSALVARFVQAEYEDRYDLATPHGEIDFIDTYSAAYRRDVFLENGGFDETLTDVSVEDQELSFRLAQKGHRMIFVPEARVDHLHAETVLRYWQRKMNIGYWKALLVRWYPERLVQDSHTPQTLKLQMALCCAAVGLLPLALLGLLWPPLGTLLGVIWPVVGALLLAFLVSALGFLRKLARRSWGLALFGVPMLFVRAAALSGGYLAGQIRFAGARRSKR